MSIEAITPGRPEEMRPRALSAVRTDEAVRTDAAVRAATVVRAAAVQRAAAADRVPAHITAAAQSLGISATQISRAFAVGSNLAEVAKARGISHDDVVAAMVANPPAGFTGTVRAGSKAALDVMA